MYKSIPDLTVVSPRRQSCFIPPLTPAVIFSLAKEMLSVNVALGFLQNRNLGVSQD